MPEKLYSTFDIVKRLGIPRGRLREWIDRGYIKPYKPADGQGTKALFSKAEIYAIALFRSLIDGGLAREEAAKYVQLYSESRIDNDIGQAAIFTWNKKHGVVLGHGWPLKNKREISVSLDTGTIVGGMSDKKTYHVELMLAHYDEPEEWDFVLIINFRKIRKIVNEAFA